MRLKVSQWNCHATASDSFSDYEKGRVQSTIILFWKRKCLEGRQTFHWELIQSSSSLKASPEISWGMLWPYQRRQTRIGCQVISLDEDGNLCVFQPTCTSSKETLNSPVWLMKPHWIKKKKKNQHRIFNSLTIPPIPLPSIFQDLPSLSLDYKRYSQVKTQSFWIGRALCTLKTTTK